MVCGADPRTDPRPHRMINWLKSQYLTTAVGFVRGAEDIQMDGVHCVTIIREKAATSARRLQARRTAVTRMGRMALRAFQQGRRIPHVALGHTKALLELDARIYPQLAHHLTTNEYDLIVNHDLRLLPLVINLRKRAKILFDAREYYPRNFEDRLWWRLVFQPENHLLCNTYLSQCDQVITVSAGLANEYDRVYGVLPAVIMSWPPFVPLSPRPTREGRVRVIHHGRANPSRRIESMIETMDHVDERFTLDLMLVPATPSSYLKKLHSLARERKNVKIVPPVAMKELVAATNEYDIGLFLCKPTNFNLAHALPNKLFEFIQARLAVAIGPSIEMQRIVREYDCGVVSDSFEPRSLAHALNRLTADKITYYKQQSHRAASELTAEENAQKAGAIVRDLIGE